MEQLSNTLRGLGLCLACRQGILCMSNKSSRGFEPRSLDSESRVLTVTPRGLWCLGLQKVYMVSGMIPSCEVFRDCHRALEMPDRTPEPTALRALGYLPLESAPQSHEPHNIANHLPTPMNLQALSSKKENEGDASNHRSLESSSPRSLDPSSIDRQGKQRGHREVAKRAVGSL